MQADIFTGAMNSVQADVETSPTAAPSDKADMLIACATVPG